MAPLVADNPMFVGKQKYWSYIVHIHVFSVKQTCWPCCSNNFKGDYVFYIFISIF